MKVRYTRRAQIDIEEIFIYIENENPKAALAVEHDIRIKTQGLSDYPEIGVATDMKDVRRLPLTRYPYTIFYRVNWSDKSVDVLRVMHGARVQDLKELPE